jgi:DNA-binding transcriptional LysR family regulator
VKLIAHGRRLEALLAIADCGSFSAAGSALLMTQSAVSQHVMALERETGTLLVERGTRPLVLTEAGHALARHARAVVARLDNAEQELMEITRRRDGRLRLGSFPTALATFVPAALGAFRREHPEVSLTVVDDHLQRLLPRLDGAELDLAIVFDQHTAPASAASHLHRVHLFDDRYRVALPKGHRLGHTGRPIRLGDLKNESWIGGGPGSAWFRLVRSACADAGFDPHVVLSSDDYVACQSFVAAGMGVAVMPGLALERPLPGVQLTQLLDHEPTRRIWAAHLMDSFPSAAARDMTELLQRMTRPRRRPTDLPVTSGLP